ncbi:MAG: imidazole glycerol phosphate synthase subunit HisF [Syntrophales bacterium]|nr:imidazole glycerol phosphate synthase subunit HisF [Syntrophales bacterium]
MLSKRIIICLDVREGKTTKGIKFKRNVDIGDPVAMAAQYYEQGVDELVFYDITASSDKRDIIIDVVENVAKEIFIPFSVGGGIRSLDDMHRVLAAGAEKISINTAAVEDPDLIYKGAKAFGSQCIVLGMDAKRVEKTPSIPSGYEVYIHGGRTPVAMDAIQWARRAQDLGAGEICLNSIDADGTNAGYELILTSLLSEAVSIPVIASGGAGEPQHLYDVFNSSGADAALIASMVHYQRYTVAQIKEYLAQKGVPVRTFI